jgi:hypothetical protein
MVQVQGALENLSKLEKAPAHPAPVKAQFNTAAKEAAAHNKGITPLRKSESV